jgi:L-arabinose isomerase
LLEVDELSELAGAVDEDAIAQRLEEFHASFDVQPDCPAEELRRAARTSVALDRFVARHELDALAYYYKGSGVPANEDTMSSVILRTSLLTARHIPVAGEYEVKNVLAMKILDVIGAGGSFTECYAMDFNDDLVLMGHDGPGHARHRCQQDQGAAPWRLSRKGGPRPVCRDEREARTGNSSLSSRG